jgi:hypothetical protein
LFLVAKDWGQWRGEERRFYTSLANLELLLLLLMVGRCEKLAMDCGELPLLCWFVKGILDCSFTNKQQSPWLKPSRCKPQDL